MKCILIEDRSLKTQSSTDFEKGLYEILSTEGYEVTTIGVEKENLESCIGCFGCWIKTPGECAIKDLMSEINTSFMNSDVAIYLTPVIFGQFSANIKNAIDRSLPNMLPFFKKVDGVTNHPPRYEKYPLQIIVGYSDDITSEEKSIFIDITKKHRKNIKNVFVIEKQNDIDEIIKSIGKLI